MQCYRTLELCVEKDLIRRVNGLMDKELVAEVDEATSQGVHCEVLDETLLVFLLALV